MRTNSPLARLAATCLLLAATAGCTDDTPFGLEPTTLPISTETDLEVEPSQATLQPGQHLQLGVHAGRVPPVLFGIRWSSNDPDVAVVSPSGLVTALSPGSAVVTAAQFGGEARAYITVHLGLMIELERPRVWTSKAGN